MRKLTDFAIAAALLCAGLYGLYLEVFVARIIMGWL